MRKYWSIIAKVLIVFFIFLSPLALSSTAFAQGSSPSGASSSFLDITYLLEQVRKQVPQLIKFIVALSYVSGILLFIVGVMKLKTLGEGQQASGGLTGSFAYMAVAIALVFFPTMVNVSTATFMGSGGGDVIYSYSSTEAGWAYSSTAYAGVFNSVIAIMRLAGFIFFLKGWLMLAKLGSSHGQGGVLIKGLFLVIGGIFIVNIVTTWKILRATINYVF